MALATITLGLANSAVVAMFGEECQLLPGEKPLLLPPLARVIGRLPPADAAKAAVFLDPLMLLFGIAVWGRRIVSIKSAQAEQSNRVSNLEFERATGFVEPSVGGTVPSQYFESPNGNAAVGRRPDTEGEIPSQSDGSFAGGIPEEILRSLRDDIGPTEIG